MCVLSPDHVGAGDGTGGKHKKERGNNKNKNNCLLLFFLFFFFSLCLRIHTVCTQKQATYDHMSLHHPSFYHFFLKTYNHHHHTSPIISMSRPSLSPFSFGVPQFFPTRLLPLLLLSTPTHSISSSFHPPLCSVCLPPIFGLCTHLHLLAPTPLSLHFLIIPSTQPPLFPFPSLPQHLLYFLFPSLVYMLSELENQTCSSYFVNLHSSFT